MTVFRHEDYTVAWVSALPLEMAVAKAVLDESHGPLFQPPSDQNSYTLGSVSGHNVVIACLPSGVYGITSAATVVADMRKTFPALRFALMVGIGGGVPTQGADIRLGDVVVSIPTPSCPGVIQYDYGKATREGDFEPTGSLNKPPPVLLAAVSQMRSDSMIKELHLTDTISSIWDQHQKLRDQCLRPDTDWLFNAEHQHVSTTDNPNCSACDQRSLVHREPRETDEPYIHYGVIASGNQVMKDAQKRDKLATELGVYCFEMEAAGLMDQIPCLVIRGICDYCDSHKHKQWQGYAALTAAVYAKRLLCVVPGDVLGAKQGRKTELTAEDKACLNSLFVTNPSDDKDALKRRKGDRAPGTCNWILETNELQSWLGQTPADSCDNSSILWLYGNPGTGKSTMAITMVEELPDHPSFRGNSKTLVYFFCDSGSEDRRRATALLRAIIYQLVKQHLGLIDFVLPKYEEQKEKLLGSFDGLWSILMNIARDEASGQKYVIIDALDECDQESQIALLTQLTQTFQNGGSKSGKTGISFLITSRPYPEIRRWTGGFRCQDLSLYWNVKQDLQAFIKEKVKILSQRNYYPVGVTENVSRILEEKAGGTFLWVGIACDELNPTRSRDVVRRLEALPRGLHSLYQNLFESAIIQEDNDRRTISQMLGFVAIAQRALTVAELSEACQLYEQEDNETRLAFTHEDIEMCRLMIIVQDGLVQLLHNSVRDFLVQTRSPGLLDECEAHVLLANRCISYFLNSMQSSGASGRQRINQTFLQYAIVHWPDHAGAAGSRFVVPPEHEKFFRLASDEWKQWLSLYKRSKPFSTVGRKSSVLHIAARWGMPRLASFVLADIQKGLGKEPIAIEQQRDLGFVDENFKSENGATPMQEAAEHGHLDVMKVLLENTVLRMKISDTVLCAAAKNGRAGKDLMELLLDNQEYPVQLTEGILQAAARNQKDGPAVLKLLLRHNGNHIPITESVVKSAARNQKTGEEVMSLLLSHKTLELSDGATEEICASFGIAIIRLLLQVKRSHGFRVTGGLVRATRANKQRGMAAVMRFILNHPESHVTEKGIEEICATLDAELVLMAINKQGEAFQLTPGVVEASALNEICKLEVAKLLLSQGKSNITAEVKDEICSQFNAKNVGELVKQQYIVLELTENAIRAAARNRWNGPDVLMVLVGQHQDPIPAELCAVICQYFAAKTVKLILARMEDGCQISEDMIQAAARNQTSSREVVKLLLDQRRDDTAVTEAVVAAAAGNQMDGPKLMELLIERQGYRIPITEAIIIAAAKNSMTGDTVTKLLLDHRGDQILTTEPIVKATAENPWKKREIIALLLRNRKSYTTLGAVACICTHFDAEIITLLLTEYEADLRLSGTLGPLVVPADVQIPITKAAVLAATGGQFHGSEMIKLLINHPALRIDLQAMEEICASCSVDIITLLINQHREDLQITDRMVKVAAGNRTSGPEVVKLLLQHRAVEIEITADFVRDVACNGNTGAGIMKVLLDQGRNPVTPEAVPVILTYFDAEVATILLGRVKNPIQITDDIIKAAAGNQRHGDGVTKALLCRFGEEIRIPEQVVTIAATNAVTGPKIIALLQQWKKMDITDQVLPVICKYFNAEAIRSVLDSSDDSLEITRCVARATAHNRRDRDQVLQVLLERRGMRVRPEALPVFCKHFEAKGIGPLLDKQEINKANIEDLSEAAARNNVDGTEVMKLLLNHEKSGITITERVVRATAMNPEHGAEILRLLLKSRRVPIQNGAMDEIFACSSAETIRLLLDRQPDLKITGQVVKAIAQNKESGPEVLRLLLIQEKTQLAGEAISMIWGGCQTDIIRLLMGSRTETTDHLLQAAVSNWNIGRAFIATLLDEKWKYSQIPEGVLEAAASNWHHGAEVLELLLDKRFHSPQITKALVEVASDNEGCGARIIHVLIAVDQVQLERLLSDDILLAAATCGQEVMLSIFSSELGREIPESFYAIARFYSAAKGGDWGLVRRMVDERISPDLPNRRGVTPLWIAAANGHLNVVESLLSTGLVSVNRCSVAGRAPIFFAAANGHVQIVKLLLKAKADPLLCDINGETPLSIARRGRHYSIVRLLKQTL